MCVCVLKYLHIRILHHLILQITALYLFNFTLFWTLIDFYCSALTWPLSFVVCTLVHGDYRAVVPFTDNYHLSDLSEVNQERVIGIHNDIMSQYWTSEYYIRSYLKKGSKLMTHIFVYLMVYIHRHL